MPYYNNDDLLRTFSKYINDKANEKIDALKNEIDFEKKSSIERVDDELKKKAYRALEIDLSDLNADFSSRLNKVKTEYSRVLMEKRSELLHSIIVEVQDKLKKFYLTKEYEDLMIKQVLDLKSDFCTNKIEFRIMKNDQVVRKAIESHYKGSYEIKEISEIEIGGFAVLCFDLGVMTDQTIDTRLLEKKQWLYEHSKLAASH